MTLLEKAVEMKRRKVSYTAITDEHVELVCAVLRGQVGPDQAMRALGKEIGNGGYSILWRSVLAAVEKGRIIITTR